MNLKLLTIFLSVICSASFSFSQTLRTDNLPEIKVKPIKTHPALLVKAEDYKLLKSRYDLIPENESGKKNKVVTAWLNGDEDSRKAATAWWIDNWKNYSKRWTKENLDQDRPDGVSLRGIWRTIHMYDIVVSWGYLTQKDIDEFRNTVVEAMNISLGTDYDNLRIPKNIEKRYQNIWTDVALAAGMVGYAFPELPQSQRWVDFAVKELMWQLDVAEWEGAWHECPRYHGYMLKLCAQFMQVVYNRSGVDLFQLDAFKRMAYWFVRFGTPQVEPADNKVLIPGLGDTTWDTEWFGNINIYATHYTKTDPALASALAWQWNRAGQPYITEPVMDLLVDPTLEQKSPGVLKSDVSPVKGHILMRDRFDTPDEVWFLLKCGRASLSGHENGDCNSFSLFAYGQPMALDAGSGVYSDPQHRSWNKQAISHNNVVFRQNGERNPAKYYNQEWTDGKIISWNTNDDVDYSVTDASIPAGVKRYVRHVLFMKPDYFIIADEIASNKESSWVLHTMASKLSWSPRSVTAETMGGTALDLHVVSPAVDIVPNENQGDINAYDRNYFYGIKSQKYLEIPAKPHEGYVMVLHPRRSTTEKLQVKSENSGKTLKIICGNRTDIINFSDGKLSVDKGGKTFDFKF